MNLLGMSLSDEEVVDMMVEVDVDGSGTIEFDEFLVIMDKCEERREAEIAESFSLLDKDGNGFVDRNELKEQLLNMGIRLAAWELGEMMVQAHAQERHIYMGMYTTCMM